MSAEHRYQLGALLFEGHKVQIFRGQEVASGLPRIFKVLQSDWELPRGTKRLKNELALTSLTSLACVRRSIEVTSIEGRTCLVLEDLGLGTLREAMNGPSARIEDDIHLAIAITQAISEIHGQHIIHKDINPDNILIDRSRGSVYLIDFDLACRLPREWAPALRAEDIEGTLAYLSPEQTGRVASSLDQRSDLYALGITLYELFSGQKPFLESDPNELLYAHLARVPPSPDRVRVTLPPILAAVIMKLIEKSPEKRYQSAHGLTHDLQRCLSEAHFILGQRDQAQRLIFSDQLIGREKEQAALAAALSRSSAGRAELVLISGDAGIGKTSLIKDMGRDIFQRRATLIEGKFDIYRRHKPFDALLTALDQHLRSVEGWEARTQKEFVQLLREELAQSLAPFAHFLPSLASLLELPLPPTQSHPDPRALRIFLRRLIALCSAQAGHLVLFLDDLQWADLESLEVLQEILLTSDSLNLLVIGAYRSLDRQSLSILNAWVDSYKKSGGLTTELRLGPWKEEEAALWVSKSLGRGQDELLDLSSILLQKTQGNPFFMRQILESFFRHGHLRIDPLLGQWSYDIEDLRRTSISENVVDLVIARLDQLDATARSLLQVAACLGNPVEAHWLLRASPVPRVELSEALESLVQAELLIPSDSAFQQCLDAESQAQGERPLTFTFSHDRVQEAAHQSLSASEQAQIHLTIARQMQDESPEAREDFVAMRHFNLAEKLIIEKSERLELARKNLVLASRAREAGSYGSGLYFCERGETFAGAENWDSEEELLRSLTILSGACHHLMQDYDRAAACFERAYSHTQSVLGRGLVQEIRCLLLLHTRQHRQVIEIGRALFRELGLPLPPTSNTVQFFWQRIKGKRLLAQHAPHILSWPEVSDPNIDLAQRMLCILTVAAYFDEPTLTGVLATRQLELGIRYGMHRGLSLSIQSHAAAELVFGHMKQSSALAAIGFQILERYSGYREEARFHLSWALMLGHWFVPINELQQRLDRTFRIALSSGSLDDAVGVATSQGILCFLGGRHLSQGEEWAKKAVELLPSAHRGIEKVFALFLHRLQAPFRQPGSWDLESGVAGEEEVAELSKSVGYSHHLLYWHMRTMVAYFEEDYQAAYRAVKEVRRSFLYIGTIATVWHSALMTFLLRVRLWPETSLWRRPGSLVNITLLALYFRFLARHNPDTFRHQALFVQAEFRRWRSRRPWKAIHLYRSAIEAARKAGFNHHEAMACERLAEIYSAWGDRQSALGVLAEALAAYERWGLAAKVKQLEERHPELIRFSNRHSLASGSHTLSGLAQVSLDTPTLIKASLALSGEIHLDSLLESLMRLVAEHSGARYALLLAGGDRLEELQIEASLKVDTEVRIELGRRPLRSEHMALSLLPLVLRKRETLIIHDAAAESDYSQDPYLQKGGSRSLLCMPLVHKGTLRAVLYIENELMAGVFHPARVALLEVLCGQMAASLENATLYEEKEKAYEAEKSARQSEQRAHSEWVRSEGERQELASSIEAARVVQEALLETGTAIPECRFAWFYRPAQRAGGDWFGNYHLEERQRLYLSLADVTGHGIPSALVTAAIAGACASSIDVLKNAAERSLSEDIQLIARAVNRAVLHTGARSQRSATMVLLALDLQTGEGEILYAAHPLAFHGRSDGSGSSPLIARGDLLGVMESPSFGTLPFRLSEGDTIFLYSDGLLENVDSQGKPLKSKTLQEMINKLHEPDELVEALREKVDSFAARQDTDDTTFVALKWVGLRARRLGAA